MSVKGCLTLFNPLWNIPDRWSELKGFLNNYLLDKYSCMATSLVIKIEAIQNEAVLVYWCEMKLILQCMKTYQLL